MSKEQKIEEITKIIEDEYDSAEMTGSELHCYEVAELIYEAGYHKQEWISVEERLPEIGDHYLVVVKQKYEWEAEWDYNTDVAAFVFFDGYIDDVWNTFVDWKEGQETHVTHWMPLPEPPKMKGGEK